MIRPTTMTMTMTTVRGTDRCSRIAGPGPFRARLIESPPAEEVHHG